MNITNEKIQAFFADTTVLLTGGTGTLGHTLTRMLFDICNSVQLVIYSRDEYKQSVMAARFAQEVSENRLRFTIGDIRDEKKMVMACKGMDYLIHTAAMKQVPSCEANVEEAVKTNILGAFHVKYAADSCGVKKMVALSTDKAVLPVNLYGATKMVAEKVFLEAAPVRGGTVRSLVRFGNVANSRGSVIPLFLDIRENGGHTYPVTDPRMTRFWHGMDDAARLVVTALMQSAGGEVFISKMPSFKIVDLVKAIDPQGEIRLIGIRPGEKLHEHMLIETDSARAVDAGGYYVLYKDSQNVDLSRGNPLPDGFLLSSEDNAYRLSVEDLRRRVNTG